jgi:DeoR family suf operon transcriptional repressor
MMASEQGPHLGFSSQKQSTLMLLKRRPGASLREVAEELGISKVAALRHLASLESERLVQRSYRTSGVGRPRVHFELTEHTRRLFPTAYSEMSLSALAFIEDRLGRNSVTTLLQQRAGEVASRNRTRMDKEALPARIAELTRIRQEGGYMAELGGRRRGSTEMREHNCPILAIADRYPEACEIERRMFESLLGARVETTHRVVAGDPVCRFLIRPKEAKP